MVTGHSEAPSSPSRCLKQLLNAFKDAFERGISSPKASEPTDSPTQSPVSMEEEENVDWKQKVSGPQQIGPCSAP